MSTPAQVVVNLDARTASFSDGLKSGGKELTAFIKNAESQFKGISLQKGIGGFAGAFSSIAKGAEGVVTAMRTGEGGIQAFGKALDALPIVGPFKAGIEAISELITGTKAATIQAEKLHAALDANIASLRAMALQKQTFGVYGDAKASLDIEIQAETEKSAKLKEQADIKAQLRKDQREVDVQTAVASTTGTGGGDSLKAAQQALQISLDRQKVNEKELEFIGQKEAQSKKDLSRDSGQRQHEFLRGEDEQASGFAALADEKSLRRQGRALESAIVGIQHDAGMRIQAEQEKITPFNLASLDPGQAAERVASVARTIEGIQRDSLETIADLRAEKQRKELQTAADHSHDLAKIERETAIERLEILGKTAEAAELKRRQEYQNELAAIDRKSRDERKDLDNPDARAEKGAAAARYNAGVELDKFKESAELQKKNAETSKRLTEESYGPLEKYGAKMAEIQQARYAGLIGDKVATDLMIKANEDLSKTTAKDLNRRVGAETRRFDFALPGNNPSSNDPAHDLVQLAKEKAKADAEQAKDIADIARYARNADTAKDETIDF